MATMSGLVALIWAMCPESGGGGDATGCKGSVPPLEAADCRGVPFKPPEGAPAALCLDGVAAAEVGGGGGDV